MLIIRRLNCIDAESGIVTLSKWLSGAQVERERSPMDIGCFICVNICLVIVRIDISSFVISGGILFKILVLGVN